jgi:hypothetical protein
MMGAVDTALMLYCCQQMEMVMISFRIDIARENDDRLVYDKIEHPQLAPSREFHHLLKTVQRDDY